MSKDVMEILKVIIATGTVVIGWIVGHYYTSMRDRRNKKRDLTIQHLINAYKVLTDQVSHRHPTPGRIAALESIVTEIQLFGSPEQVEMAKVLAGDVSKGGQFELDNLINHLRDELRKELDLPSIKGNVTWVRHEDK